MSIYNIISRSLWLGFFLILSFASYFCLISKTMIIEWTFFSFNSVQLSIPLIIDKWGLIFSSFVLFISANVLQFGSTYIDSDPFPRRFVTLLLLFILSINFLIFIPHLIILLIGWDGLGIVSFILVVHYQTPKALGAGIITALRNRIGDVLIILAIAIILNQGFWYVTPSLFYLSTPTILCILGAAITKRAQIPFSSWLPAAMAAPTPVSALVHSSTLVTAGVFLLFRFYPLLSNSPLFHRILLIIAILTIFIAGINAINECDIKKIIALSTLRQLGVITASLAIAQPFLTLFHLLTHALFKALLFVCAGGLIYFFSHAQDIRQFGNTAVLLPLTSSCLLVANLALIGTPFLAGFYSKDIILEFCLFAPFNIITTTLFLAATLFTSIYSMRFLVYTSLTTPLSFPLANAHDTKNNLNSPIIALTFGAISSGAALNWLLLSPLAEPTLPSILKIIIPVSIFLVALIIFTLSTSASPSIIQYKPINNFNATIWFLTPLSTQQILSLRLPVSHNLLKSLDQGWGELSSRQGLALLSSSGAKANASWQNTSIIPSLTAFFIIFLILIILCYDSLN